MLARGILFTICTHATFAVLGAAAVIIAAAGFYLDTRPPLSAWHVTLLEGEFTKASNIHKFEEYLDLENSLFQRLETEIVDRLQADQNTDFNRFSARSRSDPAEWSPNWNRTFEWRQPKARFGALLLHGYSDSPYSLRSVGEMLRKDGAFVLGLRLPGHGTAPSALRVSTAEDMIAAVSLAMKHLREQMADRPIIIVGYSNGAALALHHALAAINDGSIPPPAALILISPEIAVPSVAALASWQAWFGEVLGIEELAWNTVEQEFDPFKYNSFAVNAGAQAYRITSMVQNQLKWLEKSDRLHDVPPILAFQSAIDATVTATALKEQLFDRLQSEDGELVFFDINRIFEMEGLVNRTAAFDALLNGPRKNYSVSVVTNRTAYSLAAEARERPAKRDVVNMTPLSVKWPENVYSLSHVALPFSPDDPLYGHFATKDSHRLNLGRLILRGENGSLLIPSSSITRQHWNPFYGYLEKRIREFLFKNILSAS